MTRRNLTRSSNSLVGFAFERTGHSLPSGCSYGSFKIPNGRGLLPLAVRVNGPNALEGLGIIALDRVVGYVIGARAMSARLAWSSSVERLEDW